MRRASWSRRDLGHRQCGQAAGRSAGRVDHRSSRPDRAPAAAPDRSRAPGRQDHARRPGGDAACHARSSPRDDHPAVRDVCTHARSDWPTALQAVRSRGRRGGDRERSRWWRRTAVRLRERGGRACRPVRRAAAARQPPVVGRVERGRCLLDLRTVGGREMPELPRRCSPLMGPAADAVTFVVATAGHVDHGKSTLLRALTGMEPDRLAEERRRGMSIELGFVWTTSPASARSRSSTSLATAGSSGRRLPGSGRCR